MQTLAGRMKGTMSKVEAILPITELVHMSRVLQTTDSAIRSDAAGLSVVIGVMAQNLLAVSNTHRPLLPTTLSADLDRVITSRPLQWHVYGSRPRVSWQWLTVIVLSTLIMGLCYSLFLSLYHWMGTGSWLDLGDMMRMAHESANLENMDNEVMAQQQIYRVVQEGSRAPVLESSTS